MGLSPSYGALTPTQREYRAHEIRERAMDSQLAAASSSLRFLISGAAVVGCLGGFLGTLSYGDADGVDDLADVGLTVGITGGSALALGGIALDMTMTPITASSVIRTILTNASNGALAGSVVFSSLLVCGTGGLYLLKPDRE